MSPELPEPLSSGRVAGITAIVAPVGLRVRLFSLTHGTKTGCVLAKGFPVLGIGLIATAAFVNLVVPVRLGVLVNMKIGHN